MWGVRGSGRGCLELFQGRFATYRRIRIVPEGVALHCPLGLASMETPASSHIIHQMDQFPTHTRQNQRLREWRREHRTRPQPPISRTFTPQPRRAPSCSLLPSPSSRSQGRCCPRGGHVTATRTAQRDETKGGDRRSSRLVPSAAFGPRQQHQLHGEPGQQAPAGGGGAAGADYD